VEITKGGRRPAGFLDESVQHSGAWRQVIIIVKQAPVYRAIVIPGEMKLDETTDGEREFDTSIITR
jgi:hypothetical protein